MSILLLLAYCALYIIYSSKNSINSCVYICQFFSENWLRNIHSRPLLTGVYRYDTVAWIWSRWEKKKNKERDIWELEMTLMPNFISQHANICMVSWRFVSELPRTASIFKKLVIYWIISVLVRNCIFLSEVQKEFYPEGLCQGATCFYKCQYCP